MVEKDPHEILLGNEEVSLDETEGDLKGSNNDEDYDEASDDEDFIGEDDDE